MTVLIDLHCHTRPRSTCSTLTIDDLLFLAADRGLDGICLTEHDRRWTEPELDDLRARTRLVVLTGIEVTTDHGHVLAYGLPERDISPSFPALAAAAQRHDALLYLAHPVREGNGRPTNAMLQHLASLEVANGSDGPLQNASAAGLAARFPLPGIAGSDAHSPHEVGRTATRFLDPIQTEHDLLQALRAGRYAPAGQS